jgi:hypothetical protein
VTTMNQIITEQLLKWPNVTLKPHRFGGVAFLYKGKEIGHLHGNVLVDILMPKSLRDPFIASGRVHPHHIYPSSSWVSIYLKSEEDAANAVEVLRAKYEYLLENS